MPWQAVPHKWKTGQLHSGSKKGPVVRDRDQMVAIMLSEKRKGTHEKASLAGLKHVSQK
jgi:hypothetical protein